MIDRPHAEWSRRAVLAGLSSTPLAALLPSRAEAQDPRLEWIVTTRSAAWQKGVGAILTGTTSDPPDIMLGTQAAGPAIEGFGACFNELGWDALALLEPADREAIFEELFGRDGARFTLCRMPIGANDFSRDWYSYDETSDDFALDHFSVARDETSLIPFIRAALRRRPDLRLWASPWSPPSWMKRNRHYASVPNRPGSPPNGLRPDQVGHEGQDMFILEPRYLDAYAHYFGRFIDAYAARGIRIGMVMPQNEFNSAQPFPSCCWTPEGLAAFIPHLGREMQRRGVDIFFGTLERSDETMLETVLCDPAAGRFIKGVGVQWAGKGAIEFIHRDYPKLRLYQSEQECGDGRNDWRYCRYTWSLMKHYLRNGASGYDYWNIALQEGGVSRWGWAQNSLVTVDQHRRAWRFNAEYWLMKHLSHFVRPGAVRIDALSYTGYDEMLAFRNPDGAQVMVVQNPMSDPMPLRVGLGGVQISFTLPPDSFSTLVLGAA